MFGIENEMVKKKREAFEEEQKEKERIYKLPRTEPEYIIYILYIDFPNNLCGVLKESSAYFTSVSLNSSSFSSDFISSSLDWIVTSVFISYFLNL